MLKIQRTLALAAVALIGATAAQAQVVGTYNGTTSDNLPMQIQVGDDGNGGLLFTGDNFQWNMHCTTGDSEYGYWGVGQYTEITAKHFTVETKIPYLYEKVTLHFSADNQTVTGSFIGDEPMYINLDVNKKVEECTGAKVTFTATLGAPVAASRLPAGVRMMHVDR